MSDDPQFPSPRRSTKPPKRPAGAAGLTGKQDKLAKIAEALFSKARREGWTRKRFYNEIHKAGYSTLRRDIVDNLLDHYKAPQQKHLRKTVPKGYSRRTAHQESAIEMFNYYEKDLQEDGADYVILEDSEGGYQVYVQDDTP